MSVNALCKKWKTEIEGIKERLGEGHKTIDETNLGPGAYGMMG